MNEFEILANQYLSIKIRGFYHVRYVGMNNPGNPNYLNDFKNTFNNFTDHKLQSAAQALQSVLQEDLPKIFQSLGFEVITVCVVPRAKAEKTLGPNQQIFRTTVQSAIAQMRGFVDGTSYLRRHTDTYTTHLKDPVPNYTNDGPKPYPGITEKTCAISPSVAGKNVLLVDDIYTPGVNVDEDAINALVKAGAQTVAFYAIGKVFK